MKLSIVTTLYHSAKHIEEFYDRVTAVATELVGNDYEIIMVNDGSPDDSLEVALNLKNQNSKLTVIDLSRNFGHHHALMCGMHYSKGDFTFLIDSDLEEEPEWLLNFNQTLNNTNSDVVFGVQEKRRGNITQRLTGKLFYNFFRFLTGVKQPDNIVTARLMTRSYVDALLQHSESEINIGGLWIITGFKQTSIEVTKRSSSETTYSFSKKLSHLINAVTSFSSKPLVLTFYIGLAISIGAVLYILSLVFNYYFFSRPYDGYTSLIASIWLLGGLIIFFLGIQGIYISKIFSETKNRPNFIIRQVYNLPNNNKNDE